MEKTYNPQQIEQQWYQHWEQSGYFAPTGDGPTYCIMIPPPNVTGRLHMGHGFQQTLMDVLIRYHRMQGDKTLWQMGCDHAGIATQMVVERQLAAENITRHDLGRDEFIARIWQWQNEFGGQSPSKSADLERQLTGHANVLLWIKVYRERLTKFLLNYMIKD